MYQNMFEKTKTLEWHAFFWVYFIKIQCHETHVKCMWRKGIIYKYTVFINDHMVENVYLKTNYKTNKAMTMMMIQPIEY